MFIKTILHIQMFALVAFTFAHNITCNTYVNQALNSHESLSHSFIHNFKRGIDQVGRISDAFFNLSFGLFPASSFVKCASAENLTKKLRDEVLSENPDSLPLESLIASRIRYAFEQNNFQPSEVAESSGFNSCSFSNREETSQRNQSQKNDTLKEEKESETPENEDLKECDTIRKGVTFPTHNSGDQSVDEVDE